MNKQVDYIDIFLNGVDNYSELSRSEKLSISMTYFFNDRKYLTRVRLDKQGKQLFKKIFIELHISYYKKIIKGPNYVKISRLILNFLFLRAKENLRLVLFSHQPYNLTAFVHGIRSQIEINALLNKFIKVNDQYYEDYFLKSEDRKNADRLINILTLIEAMDTCVVDYKQLYDELSNILHPNPRAVKLYTQAKPSESNIKSLYKPNISFYFTDTFPNTLESKTWFDIRSSCFARSVIDFLNMIGKMNKDFFISTSEQKDYEISLMLEIINQREFLEYVSKQKPETINMLEYVEWLEKRK
jgi:hypothetical protein